jgi:hypothetical protein
MGFALPLQILGEPVMRVRVIAEALDFTISLLAV